LVYEYFQCAKETEPCNEFRKKVRTDIIVAKTFQVPGFNEHVNIKNHDKNRCDPLKY
jgi:hypothetical protein